MAFYPRYYFLLYFLLANFVFAGGREGSGGGGVACYDPQGKLLSVETLETFEHFPPFTNPFPKNQNYTDSLKNTVEFFDLYSPIFASRLKLVARITDKKLWEDTNSLPIIKDSSPTKPIPEGCKFVQLAARFTISKEGQLPKTEIKVNRNLFEHLSSFDKAMLIFHEQMYLIGKETGHDRSDTLRETIALFMSKEFRDKVSQLRVNEGADLVQGYLVKVFGDYYRFFIEDPTDQPAFIPPGYTQWSRYKSFGHFLLGARERKNKCLKSFEYDKLTQDEERIKVQNSCSFASLHPDYLPGLISEEEAFLFFSRWILDREGAIENSENFLVWDYDHPDQVTEKQKKELRQACTYLENHYYPYFEKVEKMALKYCKAIE